MENIFSYRFVKRLWKQLEHRDIKTLPATIAFNLVMAMAPLMVVMVQLITFFSIQSDLISRLLETYIHNEEIIRFLEQVLAAADRPTLGITGIVLTSIPFIWSISKGLYGISSAANITYQVPLMRFAIIERLVSFFLVCGLVILMSLIMFATLFGRQILGVFLHFNDLTLEGYWDFILSMAGTATAFISYLAFFQVLFYLAPTMRTKFCEVTPGAFVTATGWSIASALFSIYVSQIANYSIYGSLASIVIILFWLYLLGYTITVGLQVNFLLKKDYFGGVFYHPRLTFGSRKITRLTGFVTPKGEE